MLFANYYPGRVNTFTLLAFVKRSAPSSASALCQVPAVMAGGGPSGDADTPSEISSSPSSSLALICSRPWLGVSGEPFMNPKTVAKKYVSNSAQTQIFVCFFMFAGLMEVCEVQCSIYCSPNPVKSRLFWSRFFIALSLSRFVSMFCGPMTTIRLGVSIFCECEGGFTRSMWLLSSLVTH